MTHEFDQQYWQEHWKQNAGDQLRPIEPNPYLLRETADLTPGTALDAGCGEGDEAIWLAASGWQVTGADISIEALMRAADRAAGASSGMQLSWVEADLTAWQPASTFDLVTTHYAHPTMPQQEFYDRLASWVATLGTLLIVGHLHDEGHGHDEGSGHGSPAEASVSLAGITSRFDADAWEIVTAEESERTMTSPEGKAVSLRDVVVRATRRG